MANDGFIEFLSPDALKELNQALVLVDELATKISAINNFKAPTTPSGVSNSVKQITTEYEKQEKIIARVNQLQKESAQRLSQVGTESEGMFSKMSSGLKSVIQLFGVYSAAMMAHRAVVATIGIGSKLSDDLAQLSIYLNNSKKAADDVFDSLKKIKTRTSLSDLLGLAEIVAKKGVAQNEIAGITQALDNMFLVMGEGLGNKEEATASIIKLITIFNTDGKITAERVRDVGASMQYLTTHGVATADYLIDFTERLGAVRGITNQTQSTILGLGAGFEQLGITSGVASTAVGQVVKKLFTDIPKYAKQAGIAVGEFKYLLETDSAEAFLRYSHGLRMTSKDSEGLAIALKNAQFVGQRVGSVVVEAGINYELLSGKIKGATDASIEHAKQIASASVKQDTFAATLDNIKKKWETLITTTTAQNTFSNIAVGIYKLVSAILSIPFDLVVGGLIGWATYQTALNRVIIQNTVLQSINNAKAMGRVAITLLARTGILGEAAAYEASNLAMIAKIELASIEIKNLQTLIAAKEIEIASIRQGIVATEQEALARASAIATIEAEIAAMQGLILVEEETIIATEGMSAAIASTGWGALAIAIGLAVYALYQFVTAETEAERKAKDILALHDKNAKTLAENAKIYEEASKKRIRVHKEENDILAKGNSDLNNKLADDNHKFQGDELANTTKHYQDLLDAAIKKQKELEDLQKRPKVAIRLSRAGDVLNAQEIANQEKLDKSIQRSLISRGQEIADYTERLRTAKAAEANFLRGNENPVLEDPDGKGRKAKKDKIALNFKEIESEYNLKIAILERKKAENADDDQTSYEERIAKRIAFSEASIDIIDMQLQKEEALIKFKRDEDYAKNDLALKNKEISSDVHYANMTDIINTYINKTLTAEIKASDDIKALQKQDLNFFKNIKYKQQDEVLKLNKIISTGEIAKYKTIADNEYKTLAVREAAFQSYIKLEQDLLEAQKISDIQRAESRGASKEEIKAIAAEYENAIAALGKIRSPKMLAIEQVTAEMKQIASSFASDAGFGATFKLLQEGLDKYGDNVAAKTVVIMEAFQEMYNFINKMSQENFDAEYKRLEEQTQIALAFAGDSDTAKAEIERQAEERRKEIQRREFKAKKEMAVFNIAIDTAQAIIAVWAQVPKFDFGVSAGVLSAFVGALGLAQIAMVSSQQMPAYKMGTDNHGGGAMLVNDGSGSNYKETIQTPDGKIYQPKERNVIMNAPKGTKVFTHDQWQRNLDNILTSNSINYAQPNVVVNSGMSDEQVNRIVSTIANKQESHLSLDKSGIKHYVSNGHTTKEILNSQVTFGR